ncbi:MAG: hypothetical protein Q7T81_08710 [Pseudolabrys sp.]|nr:hypothetical protein [Pseudolabrys sp.]
MASLFNSLICAGAAVIIYGVIGLPLTMRVSSRSLALMLAPALSWAVHSALALPLLLGIGMSRGTVVAAFAVPLLVALAMLWRGRAWQGETMLSRLSALALGGAALLAFIVMAAVLPKFSAEGVTLSGPIFDHSKVAMIDEMIRLGVPPANPFSSGAGTPVRLSYYYLWHFSAAELALLLNISGWEADAGMAFFTAFTALTALIGLAVRLSGQASAGLWAVALAASGSLRAVIGWFTDIDTAAEYVGYQSGLGGWLFQTSWAPQHTASATIALIAIYLVVELARRPHALTAILLGLVIAAGFESSTWVGGVAFPLAAAPVALFVLARAAPSQRLRILIGISGAAALALLLMSPFLYDQLQMTALRGGSPISIEPTQVLSDDILDEFGAWLDWPAFWLIYLPVELPATYAPGLVALYVLLRDKTLALGHRTMLIAFALTLVASLLTSWLLVSTLGENNDLGWRALLPGLMLLIVFAAAALSRLSFKRLSVPLIAAVVLLLLGVPEAIKLARGNLTAPPLGGSRSFAETPALWQAVRRVTPDADRIAISPRHMESMTGWPANISWALLSNRRSCYAGSAFAPFSPLPTVRNEEIDAQFHRVFAGETKPGDIEELAGAFKCDTAVVTSEDGAWASDPFAASPLYRLVDGTSAWRIYRTVRP